MDMNVTEVLKNRITINKPKKMLNKVGRIDIAFGADEAFARPMGVSMTSIILNNPEIELFFHIFTAGLPENELARLSELARRYNIGIQVYNLNESAIGLDEIVSGRAFNSASFSFAFYYRLMIPYVVRGAVKQILYLDSDIVCIGKLQELIDIDLEGKITAAVPDLAIVEKKCREFGLQNYFNSGVLYIDVEEWCAARISERAIALLNDESFNSGFHDQDALNVVLSEHTKFIDAKWNTICKLSKCKGNMPSGAVLVHFVTTNKPWKKNCDNPLNRYFLDYAALSPWAGVPLIDPKSCREMRQYIKILLREGKLFLALFWLVRFIRQWSEVICLKWF